MSSATDLLELQRAFQERVLGGDPIESNRGQDIRIGIYANAYRLRLLEALAHNFPMLEQYLHGDEFVRIGRDYLADHPSTAISVRDVGAQLADWLSDHCAGEPWLGEFARFEWALANAFDARDSEVLPLERVSAIAADDWARMTFAFTPATQRLTLHTNAPQLYRAVAHDEDAPRAHELDTSCEWLIWRRETAAQYRSLTELEALAFDALFNGGTFGDACEVMFDHSAGDQIAVHAAAFLKRWLEDELIAAHAIDSRS